jgi:hypothetical protein
MSKVRHVHWLNQKDAATTFEIVENVKVGLHSIKGTKSKNQLACNIKYVCFHTKTIVEAWWVEQIRISPNRKGVCNLRVLKKVVYTTCQTLVAGQSNMYDIMLKTMLYLFYFI